MSNVKFVYDVWYSEGRTVSTQINHSLLTLASAMEKLGVTEEEFETIAGLPTESEFVAVDKAFRVKCKLANPQT